MGNSVEGALVEGTKLGMESISWSEGSTDGLALGVLLGDLEGSKVGGIVGIADGSCAKNMVGLSLGAAVSSVEEGSLVDTSEGSADGSAEGSSISSTRETSSKIIDETDLSCLVLDGRLDKDVCSA